MRLGETTNINGLPTTTVSLVRDAFGWIDWRADASIYDLLGLVGIVIALVQLWRSRSAIDAARDAYLDTRKDLALTQVLRVVPLLEMASTSLDWSLSGTDRNAPSAYLASFAQTAITVAELLKISHPAETDLCTALSEISAEAGRARSSLYVDPSAPIPLADLVGDTATALREFVGQLHGPMTRISHATTQTTKRKRVRRRG